MEKKKLYKTEGPYKMVCGVCGGIAEYFDIDPTLVRVGWVIATFVTFSTAFWVYLACAVIMPRKSDVYPGYWGAQGRLPLTERGQAVCLSEKEEDTA